jgi:opacity protein-like surface antigen
MNLTYRAVFAAAAALLASTAGAFAADLYGGSMKDGGGYEPPESTRPAMFYARGDFTASFNDLSELTQEPNYRFAAPSAGRSHAWGGGIGMYFSPSVRGDLTLETESVSSIHSTANNSLGSAEGQFGVKRMIGLANLYYDFDTRTRFTPYLGVGLGVSRNTTTAGDGTAVCIPCGSTATFTTDGASKTNVAGALMAGFSAKLLDRLTFDAGYRFLYTGDVRTSDMAVSYNNGSTATAPKLNVSDLYAHQVRVGLRMDLR